MPFFYLIPFYNYIEAIIFRYIEADLHEGILPISWSVNNVFMSNRKICMLDCLYNNSEKQLGSNEKSNKPRLNN